MGFPFFHHPISKYIRIGFFLRFRHFSTFRIKWSDAMKNRWIFFCRTVSFSFFCHYMNQNRAVFHPRSRLQCRQNTFDIMSIDRTDIYDSHFFKKHPRYKQVLQRVFRIFNRFRHWHSDIRDAVKTFFDIYFQIIVFAVCTHFSKISCHTAYIFWDWHLVII